MVYESDFYTTRRPYRASPSLSTYTVTRREIPWEKVPFVPRPSLVPDPVTAFGRRPSKVREQQELEYNRRERARSEAQAFIITPMERARIRPKASIIDAPPAPYVSARDNTREKVMSMLKRESCIQGDLTPRNDQMDVMLPRLHKLTEKADLPYKRQLLFLSASGY